MIGRPEEHTAESAGAYAITAGRSDRLNMVGADKMARTVRLTVDGLAKVLRRPVTTGSGF